MLNKELLCSTLEGLGLSVDSEAFLRLDRYAELLVETNKSFNLTAITDTEGVTIKHFADCISLFSAVDFKENAKVIDVGTGAGFPGLVLKLVRPDLQVAFLDGTKKKLGFIESVLNELNLEGEILHLRAEEASRLPKYREQFDFATARAVAALPVLCEYCLPFVKAGGRFISMKSADSDAEFAAAAGAIKLLGGQIEKDTEFNLTEDMPRRIITVKKISQTPTKYPRASAQISKKPLK